MILVSSFAIHGNIPSSLPLAVSVHSVHLRDRRPRNICIQNSDCISLFTHHPGQRRRHKRLANTALTTDNADYLLHL